MQRLLFYGVIILVVVLLTAFIDFIIYRVLRIVMQRHTALIANAVILSVLALIIGLSTWWGNTRTRLQVEVTHTVVSSPRIPSTFDGYRIAQLSDLHLNSFTRAEGRHVLRRLADTLRAAQPDLIVFTGDLVTLRAAEAYPFADELKAISQIPAPDGRGYVPVYSVLGNHDYADYMHTFSAERRNQDLDSLLALQASAGWHMLRNEAVLIHRPKASNKPMPQDASPAPQDSAETQTIALVGVENIGEPPFSVYGDLGLAMQRIGGLTAADSIYTILLSHNPTHWRNEVLPRTSIGLTLSGHTHATQLLIGSWSPAKWKYDEWKGLYSEGDQQLYVNTGFGSVGPRVRIGIAPEVSILTLKAQH